MSTSTHREVHAKPYGSGGFVTTIDLDESTPRVGGTDPVWHVKFDPSSAEAETWDAVFKIRTRYAGILTPSYNAWIGLFAAWCRSRTPVPSSTEMLIDALQSYHAFRLEAGYLDRAFLEAAVFRMLLKRCYDGDQRLMDVLFDLVSEEMVI